MAHEVRRVLLMLAWVPLLAGCPRVDPGPADSGVEEVDAGQDAGPPTLSLARTGAGEGQVLSSAGPFTCVGLRCAQTLEPGQAVTLTPAPASGSTFVGWLGACAGDGGCAVTMDADRYAIARFALTGFWSKNLGAMPEAVAVAPDGDIVLMGMEFLPTKVEGFTVGPGLFVMRYHGDGSLRWIVDFPGVTHSFGERRLAVAPDGRILAAFPFSDDLNVTGPPLSSAGFSDVAVMALTPEGTPLWVTTIGGPTSEEVSSLVVEPDGRVLVAGNSNGVVTAGPFTVQPGSGVPYHGFVARLGTSGEVLWVTIAQMNARAVASDGSGSVWLAGITGGLLPSGDGFTTPSKRVLRRFSPTGEEMWTVFTQHADTDNANQLNGLVVDADGNAVTAGSSHLPLDPATPVDPQVAMMAVVERFMPSGSRAWLKQWRATSYVLPSALAADGAGNLYVAGQQLGLLELGGVPIAASRAAAGGFFGRISADGTVRYARALSQRSLDSRAGSIVPKQVSANAAGVVAVLGSFSGEVDFGDEVRATPSPSAPQGFLLYYPPPP